MAVEVTLDGTPTEDGAVGYTSNAPSDWTADGQKWQILDADGVTWNDIPNATGTTFTPGDAEVGKSLRVQVTYSYPDGGGIPGGEEEPAPSSAVVLESNSDEVVNVNDMPVGDPVVESTGAEGVVYEGQPVTVNMSGVTDADGLGPFSYAWSRSDGQGGWTAISGANAASYTPVSADINAFLRVEVTYTDGHGTEETVVAESPTTVFGVNEDPVGAVTVAGTAEQGETLTATNDVTDADGIPAPGTYQWQVEDANSGWEDIAGATGATFTLTQAEVGRAVRAVLSYTDGEGTPQTVESAATAAVVNTNDAPQGTVTVTGTAEQGETLTATNDVTDADGIPAPGTYQWQVEDANSGWEDIAGATGATFTLTQAEVGRAVRAVLSYTDDLNTAETVASAPTLAVENVNDAPQGGVTIGGEAKQGVELALTSTVTDADGIPAESVTYKWQVEGEGGAWTDIAKATAPFFSLTQAEVGHVVRAVMSYTDGSGGAHSVASAPTTVVENVNDLPVGGLTIDGDAKQGVPLTVSDGVTDLDGVPAGARAYKWQAKGEGAEWTDIAGATGTAFTPGQAQVGQAVRAVLSYVDGYDAAETVFSAPTPAVGNTNDAPVSTAAIAGTAKVGETLSLTGQVTDADGYPPGGGTYQWQVANGSGGWADITGANATSYTLTQAEVGHEVRVVLSYTDGQGTDEAVELAPTAAVAAADGGTGTNTPANGTFTISGEAKQGVTLTSEDLVSDADGANGPRSYQWQVQGADNAWANIDGATDSTFTLTQATVGKSVRAVVSFTDDKGNPETFSSNIVANVANANIAPGGSLAVEGTLKVGQTVNMADLVYDDDGIAPDGRSYQWQVQTAEGIWVNLEGASGNQPFTLTEAQLGRPLRAVVSFEDGDGKIETVLSAPSVPVAAAGNSAPTGAPVLGYGAGNAPAENAAITVDVSAVQDADGLGDFTYAWSRAQADGTWTPIAGANGASYTPGDADVGAKLKVEASYTDKGGTKEVVSAETAAAVSNVNDAPTGSITFAGKAVRGETFTASTASLADADGIGTISLQWERADGDAWTPIAGATAATYTFTEADVGKTLRAVAKWTDEQGTPETVVAETGVVAAAGKVITLPPPEPGETRDNAAANELTSVDFAKLLAEGGTFTPPTGVERVEFADGVLSYGTGTTEAFVARLYLGLLGREGDVGGLSFAAEALENGAPRGDLAGVFLSSAEYEALHGAAQTNASFVDGLYDAFLGRDGGAEELGFWTGVMESGASRGEVAAAIAGSAEAGEHMEAATAGVFVADFEGASARGLYKCALGREGEAGGVKYWADVLELGANIKVLGDGFDDTPEFVERHGALTNREYVEKLYQDGLGRTADAGGLDYWTGLLDSGQVGRGELAVIYATSEEVRNGLDWLL